jgi:D-alanyl-D-alanine carboxypeptidase
MRFVTALALFLSCLSSAQAFAGSDPALDTVLAAAMKDTPVPGMGVAVIHDGKLSAVAVRGNRDMSPSDAVKADDQWRILSNTKPMTATLIVLLAEQHRLSLDTPLSATFPNWWRARGRNIAR